MYCYVIFGESENHHTKSYLYECTGSCCLGEVVKAQINGSTKLALIKSIFDDKPENLHIGASSMQRVEYYAYGRVTEEMVKSYLFALIDDYKDGGISKEDFYFIMDHLLTWYSPVINDGVFNVIIWELGNLFLLCIDDPDFNADTEGDFREGLKDIEYRLRFGNTHTET